ncbi:MAG: ATP-binding protein [Planctomycetes bacterium]|nr:ATP-binding protein [Planctomycetota bacterium]
MEPGDHGLLARPREVRTVRRLLREYPVVAILGARQVGKTTLAKTLARRGVRHFDLENERDRARLAEPLMTLESLRGLVVLDEIQRVPSLFEPLRVLADRRPSPARFLLLGRASPALLRHASESLAGRIAYHELGGFVLEEVGADQLSKLWIRGGFPRSFLARSDRAAVEWRLDYLRSYLERELPMLGIRIAPESVRRFVQMVAHYHGQTWNGSEIGRSLGVSDFTVRGYLDLLSSSYMVRVLPPWHENLGKRIVKAPKVYVTDSGLLHALLHIRTREDLEGHPKAGASWEGFMITQIVAKLGVRREECYFWGLHSGAELDLLVVRGRRRYGFEIKLTEAPSITPSMRSAMENLRLERLDVVHAGAETFPLATKIRALSAARILKDLKPLVGG